METIKLPEPAIITPIPTQSRSEMPLAPDDKSIRPLTTAEEDRKAKGQRDINFIWETTQAIVAVIVTGAVVWAALHHISSELLAGAFVLIVGQYFQRTNHTKIGGVGGTDSR